MVRGDRPSQRIVPDTTDAKRAERLREVLEALSEVNKRIPIIVEGKKDALALRRLGFEGEVITFHRGKPVYEFSEEIAEKYRSVVLLPDWDRSGEAIHKQLGRELHGLWEEFSSFRDIIKILCQKDVNDIEGIPKLLSRLEGPKAPEIEGMVGL